jgi:hypothetical protein
MHEKTGKEKWARLIGRAMPMDGSRPAFIKSLERKERVMS